MKYQEISMGPSIRTIQCSTILNIAKSINNRIWSCYPIPSQGNLGSFILSLKYHQTYSF
jgi:hypothetical protein